MDTSNHKFELLKMARELLNEEYINRRAEDHNRWVAESDAAWKTRRIKLPYPPFAPYPTETEIIAKAASLYSFLSTAEPVAEATEVPKDIPTTAEVVIEPSKESQLEKGQLPIANTALVDNPVNAEELISKTKVDLVADPIVLPDNVITTVVTEPKVEEVPVVETVVNTTALEPRPLFAVQSWLQKIQK